MFDNIKLNSYVNRDSLIHKMNPLAKIIMTLLFSIFTLFQNDIYISMILLILMISIIFLSKMSLKIFYKMFKSTKYLIIFLLIINIINGFSIENYMIYVIKLLLVMVDANILITSTSLTELNDGIYQLLKPLCIFDKSLPSKIALTITLSIRFIPTLLEEANKILKAYKSRGINLKKESYKNKVRYITAFLKLLFINVIRRADELADNMELREYEINNYEPFNKKQEFHFIDYFFITSYSTILICIIVRGVLL